MFHFDLNLISICILPILIGLGSARLFAPTNNINCTNYVPKLQPPGWVFAVVWPILYVLLGWGGALIYRSGSIWLLYPWMALNFALAAWWVAFANICAPMYAFISIIAILIGTVSLIATMIVKISILSGLVISPLALWLSFASYLSYSLAVHS